MSQDDPFGLETDQARTRIRPINRPPPAPLPDQGQAVRPVLENRASDNALVSAFSLLIGFAPELEVASTPEAPDMLRARMYDAVIRARDGAVGNGVMMQRADQAAWFVAALIDDIVMNTPWGAASGWPGLPLVTQLSGDVDAGVRFFDRLDDLIRYPDRDPEMLELAFYCLSLGFRGRHRDEGPSGEAALMQLRGRIGVLLRRNAREEPLSPNWQGARLADEPPRFALPLWSLAVLALGAISLIYVGLGTRLSDKGSALADIATKIEPTQRAELYRPELIEIAADTALTVEPISFDLMPSFQNSAPPDLARALSGEEDISTTRVIVQSTEPEVFRSARADINTHYAPLIAAIASVINAEINFVGSVSVEGHTDSIPVQRSNPFQTNQGLSEARANSIAAALIAAGVPKELITTEGHAARQPIDDNSSREGRARNRRVEIIIDKRI